jgi:transposase
MARTSTPWRLLPARELGCGSPATAWRRLDEWAKAGVFDQLHLDVLDRLGEQGRLAIRWDRGSERFVAFVLLAGALTCCNRC